MRRESARLISDALAPARARRFVAGVCRQLPPDRLHDALLVTSELVSNVVWHGQGDAWLDVETRSGSVTIGVADIGAGKVIHASRFSWPEGGHGLRIVDALADRWGVERQSGMPGKRVWVELRVPGAAHARSVGQRASSSPPAAGKTG